MEKEYRVYGEFEGSDIDKEVQAHSDKQAKMVAGFKSGYGGTKISDFIKCKSIKVERV